MCVIGKPLMANNDCEEEIVEVNEFGNKYEPNVTSLEYIDMVSFLL